MRGKSGNGVITVAQTVSLRANDNDAQTKRWSYYRKLYEVK